MSVSRRYEHFCTSFLEEYKPNCCWSYSEKELLVMSACIFSLGRSWGGGAAVSPFTLFRGGCVYIGLLTLLSQLMVSTWHRVGVQLMQFPFGE